jgi:transposase
MAKPKTAEAIATWAEDQAEPSKSYSYKRLTDAERLAILTQHEKGETLTSIAQRLNRSTATIHEVIQTYSPTVSLAKRRLQAAAERMAENIIRNGLPRDHVATLKGINVLEETDSSVPKVVVQIGVMGSDVQVSLSNEALSPPAIEAAGEGE